MRNLTKYKILFVSTFFAMIGIWILFGAVFTRPVAGEYELKDGWNIELNGKNYYNVALNKFSFHAPQRGDEINLSVVVPQELNHGYTIPFLVYLSSVEAFIGGNRIYEFGTETVRRNKMTGSGYHFIQLPDNCAGKVLSIRIVVNEPDSQTSFAVPRCVRSSDSFYVFTGAHTTTIFISLFLTLLGFLLFVSSFLGAHFDRRFLTLSLIGLFSFSTGIWSMCMSKALQLFSSDLVFNTNLEYLSVYFVPIPLALLVYTFGHNYHNKIHLRILRIDCIILSGLFVIIVVLHLLNILRFPRLLVVFHVTAVSCIISLVATGIFAFKRFSHPESIMLVGALNLILGLMLDLIRFDIQKYIFPNTSFMLVSFVPIGSLIFVVYLLTSFMINLYDVFVARNETEMLTSLAYHDSLTGLFNRTKCNEIFKEVIASNEDFAIISIDLNGLKSVNDLYGHEQGDNLLKIFSSILKQSFSGVGECFRNGGDEFVVLVRHQNFMEITDCLNELSEREREASKENIFKVSSSYGFAYKNEVGENAVPLKVYALADIRMYKMKDKVHKNLI